jgi:large conductance mechanosensitive channel
VLKEFKEFLTKGNLIEIAVGLILALAFKAVVDSVVNDVLTPIISAIFGQPNFATLSIHLGDSRIFYGRFINAVVSFVIIGFVLFLVMKAYNAVRRDTPTPEPDEDILLLREIRDSLRAPRG